MFGFPNRALLAFYLLFAVLIRDARCDCYHGIQVGRFCLKLPWKDVKSYQLGTVQTQAADYLGLSGDIAGIVNDFSSTKDHLEHNESFKERVKALDKDEYAVDVSHYNSSYNLLGTQILKNFTDPADVYNELLVQADNTYSLYNLFYYKQFGVLLGVGLNLTCTNPINTVLEDATEWEKAGAAAATTLMALIPALLAFGNFYVARSSEVFGTSFLVGFISAAFSLGLPVQSITGIPADRTKDVYAFGYTARKILHKYGKLRPVRKDPKLVTTKSSEPHKIPLEELQNWSRPLRNHATVEYVTNQCFIQIRRATFNWEKRSHWWHAPAVLVTACQAIIFALAVQPLFDDYGTTSFLMDCSGVWTTYALGIAAGISAVFRFAMWEVGSHERVQIFALSRTARVKLTSLVRNAENDEDNHRHWDSTYSEFPPMYRPILGKILSASWRAFQYPGLVCRYLYQTRRGPSPSKFWPDLRNAITRANKYMKDNRSSHGESPLQFLHRQWLMIAPAFTRPIDFIKGGFSRANQPTVTSARRWRPLIVLMHHSTTNRHPIITLFTGFVQGAVLIVLTVFLGAQWGGNLIVTLFAVGVLLSFIFLGRALGLAYVWLSAHVYGLHVIGCDSENDIRGCLRILCTMPDVLVTVNGAWYFEGHRLDGRKEFNIWQLEYERGKYDDDGADPEDVDAESDDEDNNPFHSTSAAGGSEENVNALTSPEGMSLHSTSPPSIDEEHDHLEPPRSRRGFVRRNTEDVPLTQLSNQPSSRTVSTMQSASDPAPDDPSSRSHDMV